jgi:hypothetical protein
MATAPKNNTRHLPIIAEKHHSPPILQINRHAPVDAALKFFYK